MSLSDVPAMKVYFMIKKNNNDSFCRKTIHNFVIFEKITYCHNDKKQENCAAKHSRQEFMQFLLTMFSSCEELDTLEISLLYEKYYDMK